MSTRKPALKKGDKFRATHDYNGYVRGRTYLLVRKSYTYLYGMDVETKQHMPRYTVRSYVERIPNDTGKADLEKEKQDLEHKLEVVKAKLDFLSDNKLDTFNEREFQVYQALTILDKTTDKLQRAKKIAALLNVN